MRLTVTDCTKRPNGQWTIKFEVTGEGVEPEPAVVVMRSDEDVDKVLEMAAAKVREHAPKWDGVSRVTQQKEVIGRQFDVTLTSIKQLSQKEVSK